jgi:hypothetical protein
MEWTNEHVALLVVLDCRMMYMAEQLVDGFQGD